MKKIGRVAFCLLLLVVFQASSAQGTAVKPGLQLYVPTRIEWLALLCNDQLRTDATVDSPFSLHVVNKDHETLVILVRYGPNVNLETMNSAIETAKHVVMITAKSYGWDRWVKVNASVEMAKLNK